MILSASRRTDIPAFYGEWFMERIREGFVDIANPHNLHNRKRVVLDPREIEAIVFWSKDPARFLKSLDELDSRGYSFYFQFTLNDYPRFLEPSLAPFQKRLATFLELSHRLGPSRVCWRYDPVVISSATPLEYHVEQIHRIASALDGFTERLVLSFLDFYPKIRNRLARVETEQNIRLYDVGEIEQEALLAFAGRVSETVRQLGITPQTCTESLDLSSEGIRQGACIDSALIGAMLGTVFSAPKDRNQRRECLCAESVDIGFYNTCLHQCVYCYANYSHKVVERNFSQHNPHSSSLVDLPEDTKEPRTQLF